MHDCHGREIQEGDVVAAKHYSRGGKRIAVKVIGCNDTSDTCNIYCVPFQHTGELQLFTAKETELLLKADGNAPPPAAPPAANV